MGYKKAEIKDNFFQDHKTNSFFYCSALSEYRTEKQFLYNLVNRLIFNWKVLNEILEIDEISSRENLSLNECKT